MMNLYKLTQRVNNGYDTYDAIIVAASDEATARTIHPNANSFHWSDSRAVGTIWWYDKYALQCWASPHQLEVEYLGMAKGTITKPCVILASFNAG